MLLCYDTNQNPSYRTFICTVPVHVVVRTCDHALMLQNNMLIIVRTRKLANKTLAIY